MDKFTRQSDFIKPEEMAAHKVLVVGAGGIGASTIMFLSKMGLDEITVVDHDVLGNHNTPNTMLPESFKGSSKVSAMDETVTFFTNKQIDIVQRRIEDADLILNHDIIISAVDSMKTREYIYKMFKKSKAKLFIDGRMSGEKFAIYSGLNSCKEFHEEYKKTLVKDEDADEGICTAKAIIYNTGGIGSYICSIVKHYIVEEDIPYYIKGDFIKYFFNTVYI